ncbi:MAG: CpsD/CapB family tyrosine-protein kinase [Planctomycetes bacterium]|nr:CpsD/CapB family tyrosine-protein kinase [Planctomycetota bacterium]MBI3843448.1 CpsD/CapB family tyrosine-protein kinase [Planctomycetota bacterium]
MIMKRRTDDAPGSTAFDGFVAALRDTVDTLWANLLEGSGATGGPEKILFASATHGEGTTTIAACAAVGLAMHMRQTVALLEANYHTPGLAFHLGLAPSPGFADALHKKAPIERAQRASPIPGLVVYPAGSASSVSPGELASATADEILAHVESTGRFVLIDAPPLLVHPEGRLLLRHVDAAVLVVSACDTKRGEAESAKRILDSAGVRVLGAVLNRYRADVPAWAAKQDWF